VDGQGRPVWFDPIGNGDQPFDFRVQRYLGKPVLTWWRVRATSRAAVSHEPS